MAVVDREAFMKCIVSLTVTFINIKILPVLQTICSVDFNKKTRGIIYQLLLLSLKASDRVEIHYLH